MNSEMFTLKLGDLGRGLAVAILAAVFMQLGTVMNVPGFDFGSFDWGETIKVAVAAAMGYLGKNFLTDKNGKILGGI